MGTGKTMMFLVAGAVALLAVVGIAAERGGHDAAPRAGQFTAACIAAAPALPDGHPPLEKARYSGGLGCAPDKYALGAKNMSTNRVLADNVSAHTQLAQYLSPPQAPAFEHVSMTLDDGTPTSALGNCTDCHGDDQVLSDGHVPTADMPLAQCLACHAPQSDLSLKGKMPLDHTHALSGVECTTCHIAGTAMDEPATEVCQACHGSLDDLAALTADVKPTNPHSSPHGAPYAECSLCHMQHEPSQDFCASCHDFGFDLP